MASRLENLSALFSNVKIRTIIIAMAAILILVILVGVIGFHRANTATTQSAQLSKASNIQSVPGLTPTSPEYAQIQQQVNQQNFQQAVQTNTTAIPTVINAQGLANSNNPSAYDVNGNAAGNGANGSGAGGTDGANGLNGAGGANNPNGLAANGTDATSSAAAAQAAVDQAQLQQLEAQQKAQLAAMQQQLDAANAQQAQQQQQALTDAMERQAQQLMTAWNSSGNAAPNQQYVTGVLADRATAEANSAAAGGTGANNQTINGNTVTPAMIKAGTIIFGVLTTAVNSDEPGPVMVTIVDGQFKGAKLIGSIQQVPQLPGTNGPTKLVLSFNTMSIPYQPQSISVSAYAVDPDTARTALASDVDHHYFSRYGSLFASAFLQGYGQAVTQSGSSVTTNVFGTQNQTLSNLSGIEEVAAGLGQVGQNWGSQLGDTFNRQNTVTINSGTGVGILFTDDVSQPSGTTPTQQVIQPAAPTVAPATAAPSAALTMANSQNQVNNTATPGAPSWVPAASPGQ